MLVWGLGWREGNGMWVLGGIYECGYERDYKDVRGVRRVLWMSMCIAGGRGAGSGGGGDGGAVGVGGHAC
jgi:hypothetical protein